MKKYRIVTDNLDWLNIKIGDIFVYEEDKPYIKNESFRLRAGILDKHPTWFEKIDEKEFTRQDMESAFNAGVNRGNYLTEEGIMKMAGKFAPFEIWFKDWLKTRKC
jgi:hypothetical protein